MTKKVTRGADVVVDASRAACSGAEAAKKAAVVGGVSGANAARKAAHGGRRPGAGRRSKYDSNTRPVALTIPDSLVDALDRAVSAGHAANRSEMVVRVLLRSSVVRAFMG